MCSGSCPLSKPVKHTLLYYRNLRERFGLDDLEYLNSLTKSPKVSSSPLLHLVTISPSQCTILARVGLNSTLGIPKWHIQMQYSTDKYCPSVDKMYVIKTMTSEEIEEMHHLLKQVNSLYRCTLHKSWRKLHAT